MLKRFAAPLLAVTVFGVSATTVQAADLPAIAASPSNTAPACVTPGRMMAMIRERNPTLPNQFSDIALHYMRIGQELGVRWDYAFFQMLVETGFLTYKGDVHVDQNNFAGIAATGNGVRGESFPTVAEGVRAHLHHLMLYAGMPVENPVAERTRKVQAWGIMDQWRQTFRGPVTYARMTEKWSPGDRGYPRDIEAVANRFMANWCNRSDPAPEMLAGIRTFTPNVTSQDTQYATINNTGALPASGRSLGGPASATLPSRAPRGDAVVPASNAAVSGVAAGGTAASKVSIVNSSAAATKVQSSAQTLAADQSVGRFASNITAFVSPPPADTVAPSACRVWTASYGGQKSLIIRSIGGGHVNYTVLDVNSGREQAEADAYIAAYAKGGEAVERFDEPEKALKRAFELCPTKKKAS